MTTVMDDVVGRETRHVLQTYKRNPVTLVRGEGVRLYGADGRDESALEAAGTGAVPAHATRIVPTMAPAR